MHRADLSNYLLGMSGTALASLRVVGLMYTSLAGILASALIVSLALLPVGSGIEQATQPARQIVTELVQPTTDRVTGLFLSGVPGLSWQAEPALAASPQSSVDLGIAIALAAGYTSLVDAAADTTDRADYAADHADWVAASVEPPVQAAAMVRPAARGLMAVAGAAPPPAEEADPVEAETSPLLSGPEPLEIPVAVPGEPAQLVVAAEAPPKALPPLPQPTETPKQIKARLDIENQTAIDAARAAQVRARATAQAVNQAVIDADRAARAQLKAQADQANQAAIAKEADAAKSPATATRTSPTPQPISAASPAPRAHP